MPIQQTRSPGGATEAKQDAVLAALTSLATEVSQKLEAGQEVALSAATLAALETITVANADFPDAAVLAKAEEIRALLAATQRAEVTNLPLDIFANLVTGQRDNQIEVHFDDVNYANYLTITNSGGGQGGSQTQSGGQVQFRTGTSATGRARGTTLDVIKYRPMHEVYAGWTADFPDGGVANAWQRIGLFNDTDGVFVGYEGTAFGLTWRNGGAVTFVPRASWLDPCDGSPTSAFTRDGAPEALNPAMSNLYRLRLGWLGAAGFTLEVMAPDLHWVPVYTLKRPNASATPFLANPDLPMSVDVGKSSGATSILVSTNCWAGGTTSSKARLSDTITDRSLAETVRSVVTGKTTSGGGGYVDVKVTPSGAQVVDASGSTIEIANDAGNPIPVSGPLTDTQLRAAPVPVSGPVTNAELRASDVGIADSTDAEYTHVVATATVSGNTTLHTPAPGKAIRLRWIYAVNDPAAPSAPLIKILLGSTEVYRVWALSKRQVVTGAVDAPLVVNLSQNANVAITALIEEVGP